ncbi:MAG: glucose-6-phosphate dehydrogenase assembly protein OpcA [Solirubrobacterales bacterium]
MSTEPGGDRSTWAGRGVGIDQVESELARLHRAHQREGHALARTLNLIVAPGPRGSEQAIEATLAALGDRSPSRTLVLRRHATDRLDAEAIMQCHHPSAAGRVGVCHDRVVLAADDSRLIHAASLIAPLLLSDLPTVLWLPAPAVPIPDPRLLERAQHVLVDSTEDGVPIWHLAELAHVVGVHDLTWGRLEFWRAATAAAFEPLQQRSLLSRITSLELGYEGEALSAALLHVGWVAARAGWRPERVERDDGRVLGRALRPDGGEVALSLRRDPEARGCGGIETLTFRSGSDEVRLSRGAATDGLRDLFAEALQPAPSFARGYRDALGAAVEMAGAPEARSSS